MSERIAETYVRIEFTHTTKRKAWERCRGLCEQCGKPLVKGRYRYDHIRPLRQGGDSSLENCQVLCNDGENSCDAIKTNSLDIPGIAAAKRYAKNRLPLDIDRPPKREPKMRGRPFQQGHRPMRSRPFPKRQTQ